ncbi:hypothetical protein NSERUTF1_6815 [Nocardia seriolae]|nr:hypothetical protein NSERUTF1_6815 [Nocardia seriolae]
MGGHGADSSARISVSDGRSSLVPPDDNPRTPTSLNNRSKFAARLGLD